MNGYKTLHVKEEEYNTFMKIKKHMGEKLNYRAFKLICEYYIYKNEVNANVFDRNNQGDNNRRIAKGQRILQEFKGADKR